MLREKILLFLFLIPLCAGLAACQRSPAERIASAQKDLDKAVEAQVDRYAPTEYQAAQETMRRAREESDRKNYDAAAQLSSEAERQIKLAVQTADKNKQEMRAYIKQAIGEARKVIDQTKEEYENAKKLHVPDSDLAPTHASLVAAETDLKQADAMLNSGDIITAREKVKAVQSTLLNAQQGVRNLVALKAAPYKKG